MRLLVSEKTDLECSFASKETNVRYEVTSPSPAYVVATCSIDWIPNYETEDRAVTFSAIGDASPHNTQSFAKFFLGPIAENRAFVRCVRNFLKINIY